MRYFIIFTLFFSSSVFAADFDFIATIGSIFESIWIFISEDIPYFFERLLAYIIKYTVLLKFNTLIHTTEFAYSIATDILQTLNLTQIINSSIGRLDSDLVQTLINIRFFDAAQLIIEACLTRFILNMMGW
ncbi:MULTISPECIES: hypothetical protein [unclassified Pseudoalteromonas]|uniref:hypothetical protein n=1 Tax=unclassified Pseudoalteromonas TaxID=194690 RepID=UPI0005AAB39D|nr:MULTISPECIES: hypothetical protein [unclassified Pseudoalteromonas]